MHENTPAVRIGFALEYSLGHITHSDNLKRYLAADASVDPVYVDIPYDGTPMPPLLRPALKDNWSVRASLSARRGLLPERSGLSACFFHTQVTSLFSTSLMRQVPSIVSLDATPFQYDGLGQFYQHARGPAALEALKKSLNVRAFDAAAHLVTWSEWAKESLVREYGVPADKVTVIPPGIDPDLWRVDRANRGSGPPTFLFVGGDFERKGGAVLMPAFERVRAHIPGARLLIATKSRPSGQPPEGVEFHLGLTPNSAELRALYARADVFVFPTFGDCLPLAVMEALASGLPVITSRVGALPEAVADGECGVTLQPGDEVSLAHAMERLPAAPESLRRMSEAAVRRASSAFDAQKNYGALIGLLKRIGRHPRRARPATAPPRSSPR